MLIIILQLLGWALLLYFVYALSLPAGYHVSRSVTIAKPVAEVFPYVRDFSNWDAWSPWSLHDPDIKIRLDRPTEVGGTYDWQSAKVGVGQIKHAAIHANERISLDLTFLKPFKNKAAAEWTFENKEGGTEVTWTMSCKPPLPMRPFQKFFAKMIGLDFELGLALLRGKLDPTSEHPQLHFDGVVHRSAQLYVAEHFSGSFEAMRSTMQEAYPRLWQSVSQESDRWEQKPAIAAYHKVKFMKGTTVMDMGLAVKSLKAGETGLALPAGKYFQMTLRGKYEFLPFCWNAIQGQTRMQKLKIDRSRPMLEVYQVNPMEAPNSNDWVTLLCVPIK